MQTHDMKEQLIAEVIVEVSAYEVNKPFDYIVPKRLQQQVVPGSRVIVPFGVRKAQGFVLAIKEGTQLEGLKEIEQAADKGPVLTPELIKLAKWMSQRYLCLLITAIQAMLPAVLKSKVTKRSKMSEGDGALYEVNDKITIKKETVVTPLYHPEALEEVLSQLDQRAAKQKAVLLQLADFTRNDQDLASGITMSELLSACQTNRSTLTALEKKGLVALNQQEVKRDPFAHLSFESTHPLPLTQEQGVAYQSIIRSIQEMQPQMLLLHGVTGSGKTEVYLQSISYALTLGKEAIVLVPEISLTPQMVERFKGRLGDQVAVLHSGLSSGERFDEWRRIHEGLVKVVIGARSALFAPLRNIGLIIIDEEHESTYKQEENPRYHAREVAQFRAQYHGAPVVLGSATPSLESYARAHKGVYGLIELKERVHARPLPPVEVVDMREELRAGNRAFFSQTLMHKISDRLEKKEQIVLLLNRRGYSTFIMCRDCGHVLSCPHCDISLTYHKSRQAYRCHYCGYHEPHRSCCGECDSEQIRYFGTGTQRVEEALYKQFPGIRIIRMDVDTTGKKGSHERLLSSFRKQEADCLLGTQMIAKGLDFERVTLVGVIAADAMLHLPDFRAAERTFQLLTQVSGRAGRHQLPGEVVIQSYNPEHYSILAAAGHDYHEFFKQEMSYRHQGRYPPYVYLTLITLSHEDLPYLISVCEQSVSWLKARVSDQTVILGPSASPVPKVKDRYRYQCMVKYKDELSITQILGQLNERLATEIRKKKLLVQIDQNPQMLM